jgi:hypothetical protein
MSIKLETKFLRAPHDDGGSGGSDPNVSGTGSENPRTGDVYSGTSQPHAPNSGLSIRNHITSSRKPNVKKLSTGEIHAELLKIADTLRINDPTGVRRDEARQMLPRALAYLREHFRPEQVSEGGPPQHILIRRSLRSAYRQVHPGQTVDHNDGQIGHLIEPFDDFVQREDVAATLGLHGTKSAKQSVIRKAAQKKKKNAQADVVARVMQARAHFESIQSMGEGFAEIADDAAIDVSVFDEITALWAEAQEQITFLNSLGESKSAIEKSTKSPDAATKALETSARISEIASLVRYHHARATTSFEEERVEYYTGFVRADVEAWIGDHAAAMRGPLERVLHDYIGFWLAEQAGDTPPGIRHSQAAFDNAITGVKLNHEDADKNRDFDSLAMRMMHFLLRRESIRSRLESAAVGGDKKIATPPISRHMATYGEFTEAIGPELLASLNSFYRAIQKGGVGGAGTESERNARASSFNELFMHYVRYAANVYGDHFGTELMRENGLEAQLVRAIYSRVENATTYGEEPVELLRTFFSEYVTDKEMPSRSQLMPSRVQSGSARFEPSSDGTNFVEYADGSSMNEFLKKMPFETGPDFRSEFEARIGYSLDAFKRWGSIKKRPGEMTQEDWDAKVEEARQHGYLEDVTVEPRTNIALDAILPAFLFLNEHAARQGMSVDIWDYLAAIYPVARRMRDSAVDGVITITIPSFMRNLAFRNLGYPTFAQQVEGQKLKSSVPNWTRDDHAEHRVEQPEYRTVRNYTLDLAEGSGGGIDQQRALYEFAAGFLRWVHVLDNAAYVYDSGGGLATFAPAGLGSKYRVQLEADHSMYLSGATGPESGAQRKLFFDIRRGHYDRRLDTLRSYLRQLKELHTEADLTWSDGRDVKLDTLQEMYFTLAAVHDWYKGMVMDRSATSSTRSEEDLSKIGEFYSDLRTFFEEVVFHMRARGTIGSAQGNVDFEASVRLSEHEYDAEKHGRTTLFLDDAFEASERHGWDIPRRDNLIRLKVYLGRAIAEGDIVQDDAVDADKIMEATRRFWAGGEESFVQAANDLATLEKEHKKSKTEESVSGVRKKVTTTRSWQLREPVLPNRSATETWADQWREFASELGLSEENVESAVGAMIAYFQAVPGFYSRFMEGILADAVDERVESQIEREEIRVAIAEFFPTIGIANGEAHEVRRIDDEDSVESQLAQWAVEDYVVGFPEHGVKETQVPVFDEILATFVNIQCMNHRERLPQPSVVMAKARQILEDYNRTREPSAATLSGKGLKLEAEGLLGKRLSDYLAGLDLEEDEAAAVRRAYFSLYNEVRGQENIGRARVDEAIAKAHGSASAKLSDALEGFIEMQRSDLATWRALVTDPRLGLPAYVRENFHASYVMDDGLVAFANEYAGDRLTSNVPTSPRAISEAIVGDAFSPYKEISERMAQSYRTLFAMWLEKVGAQIEEDMGSMWVSLNDIASNKDNPVSSVGELVSKAEELTAEKLGMSAFDSGAAESNLATTKYLTGGEQGEPISEIAATLFEFEVEPAIKQAKNLAAEFKKEAINEVEELFQVVGATVLRSAQIYLDWQTPVDVSEMSEKSLSEFIRESDAERGDVVELGGKLSSYGNYPERIVSLVADFGPIPGVNDEMVETLREDIRKGTEHIDTALASIDASTTAVMERLEEIEATREERELAQNAARVRTTVADTVSALAEAMEKLEGFETELAGAEEKAKDIETKLSDSAGDVQAKFEVATSAQAELAKTASKLSTRIAAAEGRIAKLLEAEGDYADAPISAQPLPKAMEMLDSSNAFTTEEEVEEQLGLITQLEEVQQQAALALGTDAPMKEQLDVILGNVASAIDEAEAKMPIGAASGLPEAKEIPEDDNGIMMSSKVPNGSPQSKAQKLLGPLMNGRILTVGNESYLITASEVTRVDFWFKRGRSNTSITRDYFGNQIKLLAALRGVRVDTFSSLPDGHPFRAMISAISQVLQESSSEATLLSQLAKPAHQGLLNELFAHLSKGEVSTNLDEARAAMREWFVANAERIIADLGSSASRIFAIPHMTGEINYAEDNVSDDYANYTPEEHAARGRRFSTILSHPELGRLIVKYRSTEGDGEKVESLYYVDIAETQAALSKGTKVVQVFVVDGNRYEELDLRQIKSRTPVKTAIEQNPVSAQPERVANLRLQERVYNDPKLMALGWLLANLKSFPPELVTFINQALLPVRMTPFGKTPPISLLYAQDAAVTAYIDVMFTKNKMPELARVKDEAISKYIDIYTDAVLNIHAEITEEKRDEILSTRERLKANFGIDAQLRRMLAKAYLASLKVEESGDQELYYHSMKGFMAICNMDNLSVHERKQAAEALDSVYAEMRPQILSSSTLLQKSTGMHAPHKLIGYVEQDKELAEAHPETAYVGAVQMKRLQTVLRENRANLSEVERRFAQIVADLMELFPDFAGALSIIGMVFAALPKSLHDEITAILREYKEAKTSLGEGRIAGFRSRIRNVYAEHAEIIRNRLGRERPDGQTFANYLTGMEDPWADKTDWKNHYAEEALFAIAPEFSKVSKDKVEAKMKELAGNADVLHAGATKFMKAMFGFMERYPELSPVVVMVPSIIKHLPRGFANEMFDRFFDYPRGAWNDPKIARRIAGGDASMIVHPDRLFIGIIAGNIREVRKALSKPVPEMNGKSTLEWFTGLKEPWKPDTTGTGSVEEAYLQLLPLMDLALTQGMNLAELEKHIEARLAKLKLLPGKQKLEQYIFLWREKQKEMIEGIPNSDSLPELLVKIMLAIEKAEILVGDSENLPLTKEITASLAKTEFTSRAAILKNAYAFMVNRRMEITQATRELISPKVSVNGKIINGKGSGGKGSGGEGAPPAASSGGSAPPANSAPTSSSQGFKGIARSSAESVYDAEAAQPWITDAEALYVESGMEFMAGSMGAAALAATAAHASAGMAF